MALLGLFFKCAEALDRELITRDGDYALVKLLRCDTQLINKQIMHNILVTTGHGLVVCRASHGVVFSLAKLGVMSSKLSGEDGINN